MLRPRKTIFAVVMTGLTLLLAAVPVLAQQAGKPETFKPQVTGVPGSPSATTTISGKQLPAPRPEVRRCHQGGLYAVEAVVAPPRGSAQGRAERAVS